MTPREVLEAENEALLIELGHWPKCPVPAASTVRIGEFLIDTDAEDDEFSTIDLPDDEPGFIDGYDNYPEFLNDMREDR